MVKTENGSFAMDYDKWTLAYEGKFPWERGGLMRCH